MSHHPSDFDSENPATPEPQLQVVVHAGPLAGKGFPIIGDNVTFGRDPENDIFWEDNQVSRRHAHILRREGKLVIEDLGSTNGTQVNGKRIDREHILQPAEPSRPTALGPGTLRLTQQILQPAKATGRAATTPRTATQK